MRAEGYEPMKMRILGVALALWLVWARGAAGDVAWTETGSFQDRLCAPRFQLRHPQRCFDHGPGGEVIRLTRQGLYPRKALPTNGFDDSLASLPLVYLRVHGGGVNLYPSRGAAKENAGATDHIGAGFVFLSSSGSSRYKGSTIYSTSRGYVSDQKVEPVSPSTFHGLTFRRTPDRPFGWVNAGGTCSQRAPGVDQASTERCFTRFTLVQVYEVRRVDDRDWYRIAPEEWVEGRFVGVVDPDSAPPEGVEGGRWVSLNLYEQTLSAYEDGDLVFATMVSTGRRGFWTRPGTFQVWGKYKLDDMSGGDPNQDGSYYYLQDVPWVLYFDQARALHGTYWHAKFGKPTSHGCVNLSIADAHWIFEFAQEGTSVYVWDPSGETPTDPSLYGAGGA